MPDVRWYSGRSGVRLTATASIDWNGDVLLVRDAVNILALKNGENAQEFRVYSAVASAKYGAIKHDQTNMILNQQGGSGAIQFDIGGTAHWQVVNAGDFTPQTDNIPDLGSSSTRVRTGYFGTSLVIGSTAFSPSTTTTTTVGDLTATFSPTAAGPSFAALHVNPTLNGVSTGTAYALAVYPRTNVLAGGRLRIAGFGTSAGTFASGTEGVLISTGYAIAGTMTTVDPTTNEFPVSGGVATGYAVYAKSNKFVIAYYNAGNQLRYITIPLDGATTTWTQTATAP